MQTKQLWDSLAVESSESAVLSVVYEKQSDETFVLRGGSLLVGPPDIETGWPAWRLAEGHKPTPAERDLEAPAEFIVDLGEAIAGRATMPLKDALAWIRSVLEHSICPVVGQLPEARAGLTAARAPIRVTTQSATDAGALAVWLARPIQGFYFPPSEPVADMPAGRSWNVGGVEHFNPAVDLLGIRWFDDTVSQPGTGFLLGRMERRAWLAGQQLRPDDDLYEVSIGMEPDRVDVADLEIEVEERRDGELVVAERLRLEDTDLREVTRTLYEQPPSPPGRPIPAVLLPTLGRAIRRTVRLHHRDGELLDEWQPFNIVESIEFSMEINGIRDRTSRIGERRDEPQLVELLGAAERVKQQYAALRRHGLYQRLFDDPQAGARELRSLLVRASGDVMALDPWLRDWQLLTGLQVNSTRVLIGNGAPAPPTTFDGQVARWRGKTTPFHDRFFLWEGGGVAVGTSAGSITHRLFRIARVGAAESAELRERFALWWADPGFERIH